VDSDLKLQEVGHNLERYRANMRTRLTQIVCHFQHLPMNQIGKVPVFRVWEK
jgi:hypothetical protein